jgi:uncharacterized RDD family membrane protein YckC
MYAGDGAHRDEPASEGQSFVALPYAGLLRRLLAFLIDLVLGLISSVLVIGALGFVVGLFGYSTEDIGLFWLWRANLAAGFWILGIFTYVLYFVVPEARSGATLGKRLLRLRVVTESGHPIDWTASILRNLIRPIDAVGGFVFALGARHQRLGDRAANTVVLRG